MDLDLQIGYFLNYKITPIDFIIIILGYYCFEVVKKCPKYEESIRKIVEE
jgi:hypothetical protein